MDFKFCEIKTHMKKVFYRRIERKYCMEIKRHKVENRWFFGEYDFYIDGKLVAQLRRQLIGMVRILIFPPKSI